MKVKELLEVISITEEDNRIRKIIQDYKEGNGKCAFKNMFPQHSVKNGKVNVRREIRITHCLLDDSGELILPFGDVGSMIVEAEELSSFKNFPEILDATMSNTSLLFNGIYRKLKSLEGITPYCLKDVYLGGVENISYSKCDKHVKQIDGNLTINGNYKGPILSILNISDLYMIDYAIPLGLMYPNADNVDSVKKIVNKHLQSDRDVLECQEDLITAGYKDYAKL